MARRMGLRSKAGFLDTIGLAFCATLRNYPIYDKVVI